MKDGFQVSRINLVFLLLMTFGLLLYVFLGGYLTVRRVQEAEAEGARLEDRLRVQELLYPLHTAVMARLSEKEPAGALLLPDSGTLSGESLNMLERVFEEPARRADLVLKGVLPDTDAYDPRAGILSLTLTAEGRLGGFHGFLSALGGLPFVAHFLSLEVTSQGEARILRLRLQVRTAPGGGAS